MEINEWYIEEHKKREDFFHSTDPQVIERSVLSSFAFLYALNEPLPNINLLLNLKKVIEENRILVVYVDDRDDALFLQDQNKNWTDYSEEVKRILTNEKARRRYREWFTYILPHTYGILPFIVRATDGNSKRPVGELTNDVHSVLSCDRIAQANAVCYGLNDEQRPQILVLKRNEKKGGFWQTITGGIRVGEDPLKACLREVEEEISIQNTNISASWTDITYSFLGDEGYILDEYVFATKIQTREKLRLSEEHVEYDWLSPDQAKERVTFPNNKIAIEEVAKKISSLVRAA
jgi:dATP pyrophosphohydrolase